VVLLTASGPKLFISHTELLKNEFVLWQEHNRLLISHPTKEAPFESLYYDISWEQVEDDTLVGSMSVAGRSMGSWTASARGNRIDLSFQVTNITDQPWPIAETSMCYKHRGAVEFWDPDLERTYVEWQDRPVTVRERIEQIHGSGAFWPKNQLHRCEFSHTFDRFNRVGLKNATTDGWQVHNNATTGGWMAIERNTGDWLSGIFWDRSERVCQNGPDYGCLHAGISIGYDIAPEQTIERKGVICIDRMSPQEFMALYHKQTGI
jgi:hypothetical protein